MLGRILCLLLCVSLVGCSQPVTPERFNKVSSWCDSYGGLKVGVFTSIFADEAYCKDGHVIKVYGGVDE